MPNVRYTVPMASKNDLQNLARVIRHDILDMTTRAQSGHPSSSLSAVELMTVLFFNGFLHYDVKHPHNPSNDHIIFSKGHASPLFYSVFAAAGAMPRKELTSFRKMKSRLEGHPTILFPYTEVPTGSLGQGVSFGVGCALHSTYIQKNSQKTYVLLGDGEMAEGQIWEALAIASHYKLKNLIGILDANRLGQSGPTMHGHNLSQYDQKLKAFGWQTILCDGHNLDEITKAFKQANRSHKPCMIIAKTIKGKGVSFIENKLGWHGKPLSKEQCARAFQEIGNVGVTLHGKVKKPRTTKEKRLSARSPKHCTYTKNELVSPREAYGNALTRLAQAYPRVVVLDAEVSGSTKTNYFRKKFPHRFFEMYIAEQNMVGVAMGMAKQGDIPIVNSFAAFLTRAYDQIRMSQYTNQHIVYVGTHAGTSIGHDGYSQMALQDLALFRGLQNSVVLYPSDAVSTDKCTETALRYKGISYIRNTRMKLPVLYANNTAFPIGGSKVLKKNSRDRATIIAAGVTLHEALKAYDILRQENILVRVIDVYSIKPIDKQTILKSARETKNIIVVEDHVSEGGIVEAVRSACQNTTTHIHSLSVTKTPHSGTPNELLVYENIDSSAIIRTIRRIIKTT